MTELVVASVVNLVEWPLTLHPEYHRASVESQKPEGADLSNAEDALPLVDPPFHSAGYIELNNTVAAKLFYFYFQERSRDPNAPLIFWTNGGPGCSSLFGLFKENGPYKIEDDYTLSWSEHGWDIGHNLLFVEQPVGVGFSYTTDEKDDAHYEDTVSDDMLYFFWEFLEKHPELKDRDLYISGESYAGHYLPAIADRIVKANEGGEGPTINFKGVILGNPWTEPAPQYKGYIEFAELHELLPKYTLNWMRSHYDKCTEKVAECNKDFDYKACTRASRYCNYYTFDPILWYHPQLNYYDIRKKCLVEGCYDEHLLVKFLNKPEVQKQLGVQATAWEDCDEKVYSEMQGDGAIAFGHVFPTLLDAGIRVIIYTGDQDLICNWMGNKLWIDAMKWGKSDEWTAAGDLRNWKVDGEVAGKCKQVEPFTFCTVKNAGHMVPMDQGQWALDMVTRFIKGEPFVGPEPSIAS